MAIPRFSLEWLLRLAGVPQETREMIMGWWDWLNGKKTAIGAFLDLLGTALSGVVLWLPQLAESLTGLGLDGAWVALVITGIGKVIMVIGLLHKFLKSFFGASQPVR